MLDDPALPYGLRDIKLTPIFSDGSLGTPVDLPVAQTLSFSEAEDFEELRGDDRLVAVHGKGATVEFNLEAGGISFEAWQVMTSGNLTEVGVTPTQTKSLTKKTTQSRPYFRIEGQSINDVDGDTHVVIYKAKVTGNLEGEFADGGFFITKCSGKALGDDNDNLYTFTWNESLVGIGSGGVNELQGIFSNATAGTWALTYAGQTATAIPFNVTADNLELALVGLSNIAPGEVNVTGAPGAWYVEFTGTLGESDQVALIANGAGLTPANSIAVTTIRPGALPS